MSATAGTLELTSAAGLTPRPYQEDGINAVLKDRAEGRQRVLGVAATGLGKTIVFTSLAKQMNVRTLVLVHRDELVRQAAEKFTMVWPAARIGIVKAERNEMDAPVVIASIQSISRANRLALLDQQKFGLVICDEAHHTGADSWQRTLERAGCFTAGGPFLFGVTATPDRGDKKGLDHIFEMISFVYDMRWGIKEGYLADLRAKEIMLRMNLDNVQTRGGDWVDGALSDALIAADAPEHMVAGWMEHGEDRKTLAFTPTVEMARLLTEEFRNQGVEAQYVSANTDIELRRDTQRAFREGEIKVLSNCGIYTEGFDEPSIECILMGRPTKSRGFYQQMIGRGTRRFPGKENCLILDTVGVARRHSLATAASLVGLDPADVRKGMSVRQGIAIQDNPPPPPPPKGQRVANEVDIWANLSGTEFAWVKTIEGHALSMSDRLVTLLPVGKGWGVVIRRKGQGDTILRNTKEGMPLEVAQGIAEDYARTERRSHLLDKAAAWRHNPASPKQVAALRKWGFRPPAGMTAGEASDKMTSLIAVKSGGKRLR